jgi:hypothetical protein
MKIPEGIFDKLETECEGLRFGNVTLSIAFRENRVTLFEINRKETFVPEFDGGPGKK